MEGFMKASLWMIKNMEEVSWNGPTAVTTKASGKKATKMDSANLSRMKTKSSKGTGRRENL